MGISSPCSWVNQEAVSWIDETQHLRWNPALHWPFPIMHQTGGDDICPLVINMCGNSAISDTHIPSHLICQATCEYPPKRHSSHWSFGPEPGTSHVISKFCSTTNVKFHVPVNWWKFISSWTYQKHLNRYIIILGKHRLICDTVYGGIWHRIWFDLIWICLF